MSLIIDHFDVPPALEDERLRKLTGCPFNKRIGAVCTESGCPNNGLKLQLPVPPGQTCLQVDSLPVWQPAAEVYQTQPKNRCVL